MAIKTKISDNRRINSFSERAAKGKILVEDEGYKCPKCGHHKSITNISESSPKFNVTRCARCKHE